jgi:heme exporter protein C
MMYDLANPERFDRLARVATPALAGAALLAGAAGLYFGLFNSPADYQQGDSVRIMYVHVPAAWMALFVYTLLAVSAFVGFVFRHPLADVAAKSAAPIGAVFTALALVTGSLWGATTWGTWWAWDARLTSVLVLFFLYLGYIAVWEAIEDRIRAGRIAAIVAMVGLVNVPIIKFSVDWWNSLHQPASILRAQGPSIHESMLWPLFIMAAAYGLAFFAMLLASMRAEIAARRLERLQRLQTERVSRARAE